MNVSKVTRYAFPTLLGCILAPAIASAQVAGPELCEGPTGPGTGLLTVPDDLCCYETTVPAGLARRVIGRDDFGLILLHMSESCPELALALNDFATEAVFSAQLAAAASTDGRPHCEMVDCTPTQPPEVQNPEQETETETEGGSPQID